MTKFLHASMFGSYYIDCVVLQKKKYKSKIRYLDPVVEEYYEKWVENEELVT